jgi:hypothetical protein
MPVQRLTRICERRDSLSSRDNLTASEGFFKPKSRSLRYNLPKRLFATLVFAAALLAIRTEELRPAELKLELRIPNLPAAPTCVAIIPTKAWNCIVAVGTPLAFRVEATASATTTDSEGRPKPIALDVALSAVEGLPVNVNFPPVKATNQVSQNFNFTPVATQIGSTFPVRFIATSAGLSVSVIVQILVVGAIGPQPPLGLAGPLPPAGPMPPVLALPPLPAGVAGPPYCLNLPPSPLLFVCSKLLLK